MNQAEIPSLSSPSFDSIKEISQEVIEEKQCIIQQIYKQLKASLSTTNYLTQQLETLKATTFEIDLFQLKNQGFIREDNQRSLLVLDITKAIERGLQKLILDANVEILHEEASMDLGEKLAEIEAGYKRAVDQVQLLLKALQEKQQKQARINEVLESKEGSLAALSKLVEEGKQRQKDMRQIIAQKQRKESTLQQQLACKQGTQFEHQQMLRKKEEQYQLLQLELAQKQRLIDSLQVQHVSNVQSQPKATGQEAKELHDEIELLEMELEQQKRQRALEKAEWKQELHKLKDQLVQRQADDQVQQENMAQLQNDNEGLRKQISDLKDIVIRLQKKRESQSNSLAQVGSPPNENRVTNDILIKKQEDQLAIQSPHHFLPYQINSVDHYHFETEPIPPTIPELQPQSQQSTVTALIPKHEEPQSQPQPQLTQPPVVEAQHEAQQVPQLVKRENQFLQPEVGAQVPSSPEREIKQQCPPVEPTFGKKQQIHHTNKSFPEAVTEKKDEKEVETMEKQQKQQNGKKNDKEQKRQALNQEKQEQKIRKHHRNEDAGLGLKPMKPDKPGKHRKVIRINY